MNKKLDTSTKQYLFYSLEDEIKLHNLRSGEVILLYDKVDNNNTEISEAIKSFFLENLPITHPINFTVTEINFQEAVDST